MAGCGWRLPGGLWLDSYRVTRENYRADDSPSDVTVIRSNGCCHRLSQLRAGEKKPYLNQPIEHATAVNNEFPKCNIPILHICTIVFLKHDLHTGLRCVYILYSLFKGGVNV